MSLPKALFIFASFFLSLLLTRIILAYAKKVNLLDIPNSRSSHSSPTPEGGGVGFVFVFLCGTIAMPWILDQGLRPHHLFWTASLLIIATLGWLDDKKPMSSLLRLSVHLTACYLVVRAAAPFAFQVGETAVLSEHSLVQILFTVASAWMLNLFNFMDGIDGLAAIEVISTTALFILVSRGLLTSETNQFALLLSVTVAAFLFYNFPPAKIFMGDVGSGFLGLAIAGLVLFSTSTSVMNFWIWIILLGVFIVDSGVTLLTRLFTKKNILLAHRTHAYQHAAIFYQSHRKVALATLAINTLWLFPIAALTASGVLNEVIALFIAYTPLIFLALKLRAGRQTLEIPTNAATLQ